MLSLDLEKIEVARAEIEYREASVIELASLVAEFGETMLGGGIFRPEFDLDRAKELITKLKEKEPNKARLDNRP